MATKALGQIELRQYLRNHGFVASRHDLLSRGFSATRIDGWLRNERLVPLFRSVYSYGRDIETRDAAWKAALLVAGPGSALTGRSALEKWGAVKLRPEIPYWIEVATPADRAGEHRGVSPALCRTRVRVVRRSHESGDIRRKDGLELVRAALALLEFAANASERDVRFAFLELCRLGLFGASDVPFCFRRVTGRRGARKVKPLLALWVPQLNRLRSAFEGLFLLDWVERRLKMPELNVKVFGREVDFLWREEGLVLELDGGAFHSDPIARQRDLEKTRSLESKRLRVIRISWKEFAADPAGVIDRLARELGLI